MIKQQSQKFHTESENTKKKAKDSLKFQKSDSKCDKNSKNSSNDQSDNSKAYKENKSNKSESISDQKSESKDKAVKSIISSLYQGMSVALIGNIVFSTVYFFFYRLFKNIFLMRMDKLSSEDIFMVTLLAGTVNSLVTNPFFQVWTLVAADKHGRSATEHIKSIYKQGGILNFWKGSMFSILLVINPIINFTTYEKLRLWIVEDDYSDPGAICVFLIATVSKTLAAFLTHPLLTLKTVAFTEKESKPIHKLIFDYITKEGFFALFRGLKTKLVRTTLSNSLAMIVFEKAKAQLMNIVRFYLLY